MERLSILTPSLNYAQYIRDAISSINHQNVERIEHVIVDGGSADATIEILKASPPNVVWVSATDSGQSEALNRALDLATGDLVGWLNADEFYLSGALEKVTRIFSEEHDVDVVYGDTILVDSRGAFIRLAAKYKFSASVLKSYGCYFASCSTFFRRRALADFRFDSTLKRVMDWDLWLRLASTGAKFRYVKLPLGAYRIHTDQVTHVGVPPDAEEHVRVRERYGLTTSSLGIRASLAKGTLTHGIKKLAAGSYLRESRASLALSGTSMRWFDPTATGGPVIPGHRKLSMPPDDPPKDKI